MTGRQHELTTEITEQICAALSITSINDASLAAGITRASYHNYHKRGRTEIERRENGEKPRKEEQIFVDFVDKTTRARVHRRLRWAKTVQEGAKTDHHFALKMLAREDPEAWGDKSVTRVEHSGPGGGPVELRGAAWDRLEAGVVKRLEAALGDVIEGEVVEGE